MATQVALLWKLSPEGASPGCSQQCEWVRCLELRGRAGVFCLCAESRQSCLLRWAFRTASQGQPFPLSPHGPPWQQELSFVVGCQERASSLYSFKEWEREGRKREPVSEWPPALLAPGL